MNKNINTILVVSAVALTVTGCAGRTVHLKNAQGVEITCKVSTGSAMMTGVLMRDSTIDDCVKEKEAAGFKLTRED